MSPRRRWLQSAVCATGLVWGISGCGDDNDVTGPPSFNPVPVVTHDQLKAALLQAVGVSADAVPDGNAGLNLNMWATVVDTAGVVVAVVYSGTGEGDQWQGSRIISAQKANTANSLSLTNLALSTANLYSAVQPGGSLFGLQESNPVNTDAAYGGNADDYGTVNDFMIGKRIGGVNVFGGGLALYDATGAIIGAVGVSGDTSCADHSIAWKTRHALSLDYVPGGVDPLAGHDNIVFDIDANGVSPSGWGHPLCPVVPADVKAEGEALPTTDPVRTVVP